MVSATIGFFVRVGFRRSAKWSIHDEPTMLGVKCSVCFGICITARDWLGMIVRGGGFDAFGDFHVGGILDANGWVSEVLYRLLWVRVKCWEAWVLVEVRRVGLAGLDGLIRDWHGICLNY